MSPNGAEIKESWVLKTYRTALAGELGANMVQIIDFFKAYIIPKLPAAFDRADRSCLIHSAFILTVTSTAQLRSYRRPSRGGGGECRRACERTPSGAAAGGRLLWSTYVNSLLRRFLGDGFSSSCDASLWFFMACWFLSS
jgi:hypothetical protein